MGRAFSFCDAECLKSYLVDGKVSRAKAIIRQSSGVPESRLTLPQSWFRDRNRVFTVAGLVQLA
jgi:hypothetical protein